MASGRNGTLYIGVTSNPSYRNFQHKSKMGGTFTKRYNVNMLVYMETFDYVYDALAREKAMKKWNRAWKIELIEKSNPDWRDLSADLMMI
jgi:putative endonuclease